LELDDAAKAAAVSVCSRVNGAPLKVTPLATIRTG
jgi:hypothetical protein